MRMNQLDVALKIMEFLWDAPMSTTNEIAKHINYCQRHTKRYLNALVEHQMIHQYPQQGWRALGQFKRREL